MHTVCELPSFRRDAEDAGMSAGEIDDLIEFLSFSPMAGDEIAGTGGCRKVRVAGRGKGKSGGYRTITFFTGSNIPLFLVTVFSKGEKANLSKADRNFLADLTRVLVEESRKKVVRLGKAAP